MLRILPLASSFHSRNQVQATLQRVSGQLHAHGLAHEVVSSDPDVLLIVTGGTEHLALQALEGRSGPVLLLAHPDQNSLPASLEILAHAHQQGRKGRVILLGEQGLRDLTRLDRHVEVHKRMKSRRLGRIGTPSDWLVGSMPKPAVAREAWGTEIVDIPLAALREAMKEAADDEVKAVCEDFRAGAREIREPSGHDMDMASRVTAGLRRVVREQRLDACTVRCFDLVVDQETTGCLALSALLDEGIVAGCEGDLPAALTMLWLQETSGRPTFMANPQDLDPSDRTLWLAHCTIARRLLKGYALRSHFESSKGVGIQGELEPGHCTVARIGGRDLRDLFLTDGAILENGHSELRCRTQIKVRLEGGLDELLRRPMGNHHVVALGHWGRELKEFHDLFVAKG